MPALFYASKRPSRNVPRLVILVVALLCSLAVLGNGGFRLRSATPARKLAEEKPVKDPLSDEEAYRERILSPLGSGKSARRGRKEKRMLSKEQAWKMAPDGFLIITMANHPSLPFVLNWVYHLRKVAIESFAVGCLDVEIEEDLKERGINHFSMGMGDVFFRTFIKEAGSVRARELVRMLDMGLNVIFTDADVVFVRNPIPFWKEHWEADILASTDNLDGTDIPEKLDSARRRPPGNLGILFMKPTAKTYFKEWLRFLMSDLEIWDQLAFNMIKERDAEFIDDHPDLLVRTLNGTTLIGFLPATQFCPGHVFFTQDLPRRLRVPVYAVHTTYQKGEDPGKRQRFREALLWDDPPEYFDSPNGFMMFDLDLPKDLMENASPKFLDKIWLNDTHGHFALVNHQITQVRSALSIAHVLKRTLIMPQLWCGADNLHFPHPGVIMNMTSPFKCPMDHIFNPHALVPVLLPNDTHSPRPLIDIRESSFLRNRRLPDATFRSILQVNICPQENSECSDAGGIQEVDGKKILHLKGGLTDVKIQEALGEMTEHKILHFDSMLTAFGGYENEQAEKEFKEGTKKIMMQWCCVWTGIEPNRYGGEVMLDLYHDIIPHADSLGRVFNSTWEPILAN
ncbi:hypothetical protein BSKO_11993 [Bryopsis sp. KO-2023]|nr:hypothetical protein BSKO_11993 [Bryopsis sp. KO-2023]